VVNERNLKDKMNLDSYIPISSLEHNKTYSQIFLVSSINHSSKMRTKQGNAFARIVLKDVTGEINGVIWDYNNNITEGQYHHIQIETKLYGGELQFQATSENVTDAETPLNKFDYVKGVNENTLVAYAGEVEDNICAIEDDIYRDIMGNAVNRLGLLQQLSESPYGITGPMAYKGGLLVHVAHSMRLALVAISQAKELEIPFNPSLVIAGCALRNIGWHTTTCFQGDHLRPRDAYRMTGIQRASARYIDHLMITCEGDLQISIPEGKRQALENMCNKQPEIYTVEGKIVSCADNMADVLDFSVASLQRKNIGNWKDELFVGHL
jgi:hypothetical protein